MRIQNSSNRRALARRWLSGAMVLFLVACTAKPYVNQPLEQWSPVDEHRIRQTTRGGRDNATLVLLAFSGGGTRAAAFAYGVLQELAATEIITAQGPRRLLDEVDVISSVSGGSFTNAYFTLYGDRIFEDFEERFLRVTVQRELEKRLLTKSGQLGSRSFGRSDMAAELYDEILFDNKTFSDFKRPGAPLPIINSTDIASGMRISFTPGIFGLLCADLESYPVSRAAAASSAVPGLATPITLKNYAGQCGFDASLWLSQSEPVAAASPLSSAEARGLSAYLDAKDRPHLHLVDGGISDNLGLRAFYSVFSLGQSPEGLLEKLGHGGVRQVLMISVNAATHHYPEWGRDPAPPKMAHVLGSMSDVLMSRYTNDTKYIVRTAFQGWADAHVEAGKPMEFDFIEVSFSQERNPLERQRLNDTPTAFQIEDEQVDSLIRAGRQLLRQSSEYRNFVLRNQGTLATE